MADKPKKKPRHTSLVLPGEKTKKAAGNENPRKTQSVFPARRDEDNESTSARMPGVDRLSRTVSPGAAQPTESKPFDIETSDYPAEGAAPANKGPTPTVEELLEATPTAQPEAKAPAAAQPEAMRPVAKPPAEEKTKAPQKMPSKKKAKGHFKAKKPAHTGAVSARPKAASGDTPTEDDLPENAIRMPRTGPRYTAVRRKKRNRRIGAGIVALLIVAALALYLSGAYLTLGMAISDGADSLRIALTPGDGYPADFTLPSYVTSESMGSRGFAALGEKDFYIYSSGGVQLQSVQHGYPSPGISAGDTRVCLYNQNGREYTIEGRGKTIARRTAEGDILFAELAANGRLALVTLSRYQATLDVYGPTYREYEMRWPWPIIDEIPVAAAFHPDNRTLALGCLAAEGGGLDTVIHILDTKKGEEGTVIQADSGASLVALEYISSGRLLALYESYAALYCADGSELARFDYSGRQLMSNNIGDGRAALVLGSTARESLDLVLLDGSLAELFTVSADNAASPKALACPEGAILLLGQEVLAYSNEGELLATDTLEKRAQGLVWGGQPLALCSGEAESLAWMLEPPASPTSPAE